MLIETRQVPANNLKFLIHLIQSLVNLLSHKSLIDEVMCLVRPMEQTRLVEAVNISEELATQWRFTPDTKEDTNSDPINFIIWDWIDMKLLYALFPWEWNPSWRFCGK
jgi:hypothetical protein